jgi:hypothetical protein
MTEMKLQLTPATELNALLHTDIVAISIRLLTLLKKTKNDSLMSFLGSVEVWDAGVGGLLLANRVQKRKAIPDRTRTMKLNSVIWSLNYSSFVRSLDTYVEGKMKPKLSPK